MSIAAHTHRAFLPLCVCAHTCVCGVSVSMCSVCVVYVSVYIVCIQGVYVVYV